MKKDIVCSCPLCQSAKREDNSIRDNLKNVGSDSFYLDTTLTFFEIAAADGKYFKKMQGRDLNVEVTNNSVLKLKYKTEFKVDGKIYHHHYVSYNPPMKFEIYKEWLSELRW